jgi:hypothetical protein
VVWREEEREKLTCGVGVAGRRREAEIRQIGGVNCQPSSVNRQASSPPAALQTRLQGVPEREGHVVKLELRAEIFPQDRR